MLRVVLLNSLMNFVIKNEVIIGIGWIFCLFVVFCCI